MAVSFEIVAHPRSQAGTAMSRRMRRQEGCVPAILYGAKETPLSLSIDHNALLSLLKNSAFYSSILTVKLENKTYPVVLKAIQRHPFKPKILHLDLLRVTDKEKITLSVPLRFSGEEVAPGVKKGGGMVSYQINNIVIQCLPAHLPEFINVDISALDLHETVTLSQLQLPEGVNLVKGDDRVVVTILPSRVSTVAQESTPA